LSWFVKISPDCLGLSVLLMESTSIFVHSPEKNVENPTFFLKYSHAPADTENWKMVVSDGDGLSQACLILNKTHAILPDS
jgi:hypothetical protein